MRSREDVEAYLLKTGYPYEEVGEALWLVRAEGRLPVAIALTGDLVVFSTRVMPLERVEPARRAELFEWLLRRNASEVVHGAYGLSEGEVVLSFTLRLQNLDYGELAGTLTDFVETLERHRETLERFSGGAARGEAQER